MYEAIVESTESLLKSLPTPIPAKGFLAGFRSEIRNNIPNVGAAYYGDNLHFPMGTAYLKFGIPEIAKRASENAAKQTDAGCKELLQSIAVVYKELNGFLERYSDALYSAAGHDNRLLQIAKNMQTISQRKPEHFDEALQLYSLMWELRSLTIDVFGSDIGRMDIHLLPWFEKDIASGYITENQVLDLLLEFWDILNDHKSGDTLINIMLGGSNPDGSDAGSRLSVLMLQATMICKQSEPHINVRMHSGMRKDLYDMILRVLLMGQGQPTIYNDAVVIPSLIRFGISKENAYNYANDGCTEILIDGHGHIRFNHIDAVAVFETAFYNGQMAPCMYKKKVGVWDKIIDGKHIKSADKYYYQPHVELGYESGKVEDCKTFQEFYECFLRQYHYQTIKKANNLKLVHQDFLQNGLSSVFLNGTYEQILENGIDLMRDGTDANVFMIFSGSIPTVADCLIAVKELVYDKKIYTISEIKEAILANFEGFEVMRSHMQAAPKFGNDDDAVDLIAADIANRFCDWLTEFRKDTGVAIMPSMVGYLFLQEAYGVAATPDGRRYGDPIAEHYCATPGKAEKGPTKLINSICKAQGAMSKACGVVPVHISLPRNLGNSDEEGLDILDGLISAAIAGGLDELNIAIYDEELLREAQRDPENHKDVIVRVWGYNARFIDLSKEMQDHIIHRITKVS